MRARFPLLLPLLLLVLLPRAGHGAEHLRQGHYVLGGNLGWGQARLGDEVPDADGAQNGLGGAFRAGYGVSPRFFLGLETSTWSDTSDGEAGDAKVDFRAFGPSLAWYPGGGGLYLRGLLGWSWMDLEVQPAGGPRYVLSEDGWGVSLALGWEWRITPLLAVGPQVDVGWMDLGEVAALQAEGDTYDFTAWWLNLTVGLTGYF